MTMKNHPLFWHMIGILTVVCWGTTFISTKILLDTLHPVEILLYRFLIGYAALFAAYPKPMKFGPLRDELLLLFAGFMGICLYFLSENIALSLSTASNVGLLVSSAPILTALLAHFTTRDERFRKHLVIGFIMAIFGIFLILFNGNFILRLHPAGDLLALAAAASWAVYSILIKKIGTHRTLLQVTRRIFFYGLVTSLPLLAVFRPPLAVSALARPAVAGHLLFLGLGASALCFFLWNTVLHKIGTVKASNYIYLLPLSTMAASALILNETITIYMLIGAVLVLAGTYISEKSSHSRQRSAMASHSSL